MNWNDQEKEKILDWLGERYFDQQRFGLTSKSEIELFLFSVYLDHLIDAGEDFDDYAVGKQLGLTISRVRALKERKQLLYPYPAYCWSKSFSEYVKYARYDEATQLVKVSIPDVNVLKDLRHFIEENGWYDEYQLNPKLFQCRLETFVELCSRLPDENGRESKNVFDDETKEDLKKLAKNLSSEDCKKIEHFVSGSLREGVKSLALTASKDLLKLALSTIPFAGCAKIAIDFLVTALR